MVRESHVEHGGGDYIGLKWEQRQTHLKCERDMKYLVKWHLNRQDSQQNEGIVPDQTKALR